MDTTLYSDYALRVCAILTNYDWTGVDRLAQDLQRIRENNKQFFICGNGGSAANAVHLANDYLYGIGAKGQKSLRVHALPSNPAILTCLANDESYDAVFSEQLKVYAEPGDSLLVLSGSGNSKNILEALKIANEIGMNTHAILGFDGGQSRKMADNPIHFPVNDMQISEDMQMMVGHMLMQKLTGYEVKEENDQHVVENPHKIFTSEVPPEPVKRSDSVQNHLAWKWY